MRSKSLYSTKNGFTMIELLVVATIIIVLTTIGLISYRQVGQNARNSKRRADIETIRQALVLYKTDQGVVYPSGSGTALSFNSMATTIQSYLGGATFTDPKNTGRHVYTYTSDGSTFSICMVEEPDSGQAAICVQNP